MNIRYVPVLLLVIGLAYSYWFGYTPAIVGLVYLLASIVSFLLYFKDKRAAQKGMWRVPENTLHFSDLLGGWPGAIIGQQKLRHKTKKTSFRVGFFITVSLNIALLVWLHTPYGSDKLHSQIYKLEYWVFSEFGSNFAVTILLQLTKFRIDM
ncbi:MAG: DUF1294 domain-containing protein [Paraglaciecola sp.]|uniref:DUF1294 domain-containing protein n=1 Tax=Paraglaciecola sp. TaxID=1920173 RepID=UPI003296B30A